MASEPLNIFQDLNLKKSLKYISFEQASIFLRSKEEKIILQRAIQILDQGRSVDDEAPPKYTLVDTQRYSMQMFLTNRQEEDLKSCERRAQERIEVYEDALKCGRPPKKPLPWFATEVPRELRRIQEGLPRELCTILQLTYLENNSQRVTGLADGKDNLQYLSDSDETRNVNPLAAQKQAILVTLGKCKITSKNTTPAVRGLLGALVSQFRSGKQFYGFESSQLSLNTGSCASCLEEFESKVCTLTCRHTYCLPCVAKFAKITLNNEYLWPAKCCQQEIPRILLEQALSSSELRILRTREKEFAVPVDQRFYCTKPKCGKFFIPVKTGDGTACPHCKFKMCTHCRSPQHKPDVSCLQDKNIQALVAEGTLEEWCTCPRCYRWIELVGDCPRIQCLCNFKFCWFCGSTSASCTNSHPDFASYFQRLQKASTQRRHERESQLDRELTLRRVLNNLSSANITIITSLTNFQTFVTETSRSTPAIELHNRFHRLRQQFKTLHNLQLHQINARNKTTIDLATQTRNQAHAECQITAHTLKQSLDALKTSRRLNGKTLALEHKARTRELNRMLASEYITTAQVAARITRCEAEFATETHALEDRFERDLALLGEQWNELSYTCSKTWVEGRAAALEGAERVLRLAEGRFEDEIRWADVTRVACLGKIDRVEEWQWEDMLLRRFREVGMGVDVVSE